MNRILLFTIFSIVVFGLPFISRSQELIEYEGPLVVGNYSGEANYSYKVEENDTIFEGPFQFQNSSLDALIDQEDVSFSISGAFTENVANGDWQFQFGKYKTERESKVVDYQYRVAVSGIQHEANGHILRGKPNGTWSFVVNKIEKSQVAESLFNSSIEYDSGVPLKSFRIENTQNTVLGRCLRNGLAHDEWSLFANNGVGESESWIFDSGVLQKIQRQVNNQTEVIEFYRGTIDDGKIINLDGRYIETLKIKQSSAQVSVNFKEGLYPLLEENANYYQKIDRILSALGKSEFIPAFKVMVEHYPLDSLETRQLDSLRILVGNAKSTGDALLNDTQLNILKLSDVQSAYLYAALEAISSQYLYPLARILEYQDLQILELISREELFTSLWFQELPSAIIQISSEEELPRPTYSGPGAENYQFTDRNIATALTMAEYAAASIESIQIVLADKLKTEKSQQDLGALEKQLIEKNEILKQLIDSLSINSSGSVSKVLENIDKINGNGLSEYAAIEDVDRQLEFGEFLLNCMQHLQQLSMSVGSLPAKDEEIKAIYTDAIWQPFISVVMDEEVKKRITTAYRKILIPHLLDRMLNELNCDNTVYFNNILNMLHTRMLELREENTSKLERKLKKEQDPLEILDLFNIELNNAD